jgi:hypothetical protein
VIVIKEAVFYARSFFIKIIHFPPRPFRAKSSMLDAPPHHSTTSNAGQSCTASMHERAIAAGARKRRAGIRRLRARTGTSITSFV